MKAVLTAALLAALTITGSAVADAPPADDTPKTIGPNALPPVPKDGGKDGPYASVVGAGIDARMRRLHCLRAEVVRESGGWWYVVYYPFP